MRPANPPQTQQHQRRDEIAALLAIKPQLEARRAARNAIDDHQFYRARVKEVWEK
jgi:hypothetical protein